MQVIITGPVWAALRGDVDRVLRRGMRRDQRPDFLLHGLAQRRHLQAGTRQHVGGNRAAHRQSR